MNCNVYLNNTIYTELENYRKVHNKSRNSIIREAITEWLKAHKSSRWSKSFFEFPEEIKNTYPTVVEIRKGLLSPKDIEF